ncbi:aldo/keto reductase, partial [Pseudomonas aeruginosa]|nr:aldo/keto reductase [Pseudomonas aeruginosa]
YTPRPPGAPARGRRGGPPGRGGRGGWLRRPPARAESPGAHDASSAQVALAWLLEQGVIAIPKAVTSAHIRQNAAAADLELSADDLRALDQAFPPPTRKRNLAIV